MPIFLPWKKLNLKKEKKIEIKLKNYIGLLERLYIISHRVIVNTN